MSALHIDRVSWHPEHAEREAERLGREASERGAALVLERASGHVPYDQGTLAASGRVDERDGEVAVVYDDGVGVVLRAHPEWNYQGGRSGRWLDETLENSHAEVEAVMAESMRAGWPRG